MSCGWRFCIPPSRCHFGPIIGQAILGDDARMITVGTALVCYSPNGGTIRNEVASAIAGQPIAGDAVGAVLLRQTLL